MMNFNLTQLVVALIAVGTIAITTIAFPFLKTKLTKEHFALLTLFADFGVRAMEQIYRSDQAQRKKRELYEHLKSKGLKVDEKDIDIAIESAVKKMNEEWHRENNQIESED